MAYYDRRGWGELVSGSTIHFPIPGKELETLLMAMYTLGGGAAQALPRSRTHGYIIFTSRPPAIN